LVLGSDGKRLAKRHRATAIADYRRAGIAPERVIGLLAATLGLAEPDEPMRAPDLVARYDPARLPTQPTVLPDTPL
jgi:glutamyl-tRNA synthetase